MVLCAKLGVSCTCRTDTGRRMWVMSYVNNGASAPAKNLSPFLLFLLYIAFEEFVFGIIINIYPCTTIL